MVWTLVIHGGAGAMIRGQLSRAQDEAARAGLAAALGAGGAILAAGGAALDAVEAAVKVLEDDPAFNAGRFTCGIPAPFFFGRPIARFPRGFASRLRPRRSPALF